MAIGIGEMWRGPHVTVDFGTTGCPDLRIRRVTTGYTHIRCVNRKEDFASAV